MGRERKQKQEQKSNEASQRDNKKTFDGYVVLFLAIAGGIVVLLSILFGEVICGYDWFPGSWRFKN